MNRLAMISVLIPMTLWAAEVWEVKPFPDWNDKDMQRVTSRSPWARQARATFAGGNVSRAAKNTPPLAAGDASAGGDPGATRGTRGGRGGPPSGVGGEVGGGVDGGGFGGLGSGPAELGQMAPALQQSSALPVMIRWQTALPMRQAQMRARYGKEAATSPEARKFLAQEPQLYVIAVTGLPGMVVSGGAGDQSKERIAKSTTLTPMGKPPIRPLGVEFVASNQGVDVLIGFPRTAPIVLEDQEVELSSQIGTASVKSKFKLKDMVFKGKLEL